MSYKFNPFSGNFDIVGSASGGTGDPGGSNTEVQFNDGGAFGGDSTFTFNKTTDTLTVANLATTGNTTLGDAAGDTLTINGTAVSCPNNLNFNSNTLFINAADNWVGIGTSSPGHKLNVNGITKSLGVAMPNTYPLYCGDVAGTGIAAYFGSAGNTGFGLAGDYAAIGGKNGILFGASASSAIWATIDASGNLGLGVTPSDILDINGNQIRLRTAKTPTSATATGSAGQICWDADYIYVCTAANTWKRAQLLTW